MIFHLVKRAYHQLPLQFELQSYLLKRGLEIGQQNTLFHNVYKPATRARIDVGVMSITIVIMLRENQMTFEALKDLPKELQ
ncbi:hypothetical protein H5410_002172 [Solanum commersonii]|uniref:Uncharacterized protein n=1 Tax=Solanum commersonii TaxID=4109 RepID=A0A9J6B251_SOLCO|nr:hypothetical protein H5410_002172 [Solanum commersonii]